MNDALTYIYYIFNKCVDFIFNGSLIANNVSIGWIAVSVIVFSTVIASVLNLPRRMGSFDKFREHTYVTNTKYSDGSRSWKETRSFRR